VVKSLEATAAIASDEFVSALISNADTWALLLVGIF
jgi:hypothetical protein